MIEKLVVEFFKRIEENEDETYKNGKSTFFIKEILEKKHNKFNYIDKQKATRLQKKYIEKDDSASVSLKDPFLKNIMAEYLGYNDYNDFVNKSPLKNKTPPFQSEKPKSFQPESKKLKSEESKSFELEPEKLNSEEFKSDEHESFLSESEEHESEEPKKNNSEPEKINSEEPKSFQHESKKLKSEESKSFELEPEKINSEEPKSFQPEPEKPKPEEPKPFQSEPEKLNSDEPKSFQPEPDKPKPLSPEGSKKNRKVIIGLCLIHLLGLLFFMHTSSKTNRSTCIIWAGKNYEKTACSTHKAIDNTDLHINIELFKKIEVNKETEFFIKGEAVIWFGKNNEGVIEYFTTRGKHPETNKELDKITRYFLNKHRLLNE